MNDKTELSMADALRLAVKLTAPYGMALIGVGHLNEAADTIDNLSAEKDRLTACLEKANISAEHFEREWCLRGDELDNLRAQLAEAQRDAERLDWIIEHRAYVVSDPDCCDGYWLNYARPDGTVWTQATEHETPRAAIDAARGERNA